MPSFLQTSTMPVSVDVLRRYHERPGAFLRLAPAWERLRIVAQQGTIRAGDRLEFQIRKGPLWVTWRALHEDLESNAGFVDVQEKGPFAQWRHEHRLFPDRRGRGGVPDPDVSILEDAITYRLPFGALARTLAGPMFQRDLERMFLYRHARTRLDLVRHAEFLDRPRLRVLVSGAGGLIGRALCAFLSTGGHHVRVLYRGSAPRVGETYDGAFRWDPAQGQIDPAAFEGVDAVVNLSGANIADHRWTAAYRRTIVESRVRSTQLLVRAMAELSERPRTFISASAVGYYGPTGEAAVDESSPAGWSPEQQPPGTDQSRFLSGVCVAWEQLASEARTHAIRSAQLRIGVVLSPRGGALAALLPWFRLGLGGIAGAAQEWCPWIGLDDTIGAFHRVLMDDTLSGPINVVSPRPVRARELADALARVLRRPRLLRIPRAAVTTLLGEMARQTLLSSIRVEPRILQDAGFRWLTPNLESCLRWELGLLPGGDSDLAPAQPGTA